MRPGNEAWQRLGPNRSTLRRAHLFGGDSRRDTLGEKCMRAVALGRTAVRASNVVAGTMRIARKSDREIRALYGAARGTPVSTS